MKQLLFGYMRTWKQYCQAPKTKYEWRYYKILFVMYAAGAAILLGGIYFYRGGH